MAKGDEAIKNLVAEAARHIGIALAGIIHLVSPDVIVLGGGLIESMPELITDIVAGEARKRVMAGYRDGFEVHAAALGDDAGAMGAAAWAEMVI